MSSTLQGFQVGYLSPKNVVKTPKEPVKLRVNIPSETLQVTSQRLVPTHPPHSYKNKLGDIYHKSEAS